SSHAATSTPSSPLVPIDVPYPLTIRVCVAVLLCFFFTDTATPDIYTLSLHDALPISQPPRPSPAPPRQRAHWRRRGRCRRPDRRSEEHTSELQSRENLVCRLLLEKKKRADCKDEDRVDAGCRDEQTGGRAANPRGAAA